MIHYDLRCRNEHAFDGWFRDSAAFEAQSAASLLECPLCGDSHVDRALMAPSVGKKGNRAKPQAAAALAEAPAEAAASSVQMPAVPTGPANAVAGRMPDQVRAALQRLRSEIEKNCDYVGGGFADEARRMHRGQREVHGIYGETSPDEAEALIDEGIQIASIPWIPRADG